MHSKAADVAQPGLVHLSAGKRGAWKKPLGEAVKIPGHHKHKRLQAQEMEYAKPGFVTEAAINFEERHSIGTTYTSTDI
jgi:hypothetical protein